MYTIINGKLVLASEAALPISDLAIQRGYGIFDFFKVLDGAPVFLNDHLDRLFFSADAMRLELGCTKAELQQMIEMLISKNNTQRAGIKIILTGGCAEDGYTPGKPNLIIQQYPLVLANVHDGKGMHLITHEHVRQMPHVKTIDYLVAVWLQPTIRQAGADDVLYHLNGSISECPRANFFIVTRDGEVVTPAKNVLKGVIRKQVIEKLGTHWAVNERNITLDDVLTAREAFVTSTTKNIYPVTQINGKPIGSGKPGEQTLKMAEALSGLIEASIAEQVKTVA